MYCQEGVFYPEVLSMECEHDFVLMSGDSVCVKCGSFVPNQDLVNEWAPQKPEPFYLPRKYDRGMYFDKKVAAWLKVDNIFNTEGTITLLEKLKCPCTWKEVFDYFKGSKDGNKYYMGFIHFIGWVPDFGEDDSAMIDKIDQAFEEIKQKYKWKIKKKINIYFLVYKVVQMRGGNASLVPNKLTLSSLKKLDVLWKDICDVFGWMFIPSEIVTLDWGKDDILKGIRENGTFRSISFVDPPLEKIYETKMFFAERRLNILIFYRKFFKIKGVSMKRKQDFFTKFHLNQYRLDSKLFEEYKDNFLEINY
ncbi:hypothetical protein RFI_17366 [Reticulomyxa filosa]|uniref:Uncharacterized protein n=1 Tax=Reticulomyxa filosa TaxID=46433 RepID=X6N1T8_RETFI|nr:hypothetical protein RFI_17366 [Reticulomyxa filosa]|eukprot:ETO19858.1 hypothetical protein RFI_17366 [Reticulomyxa filosa]